MDDDASVVVAVFSSAVEARTAASALEAAGIPSVVSADDAGGAYPFLQGGRGVRLRVRARDETEARALLNLPPKDQDLPDGKGPA